MVNPEKSIPNPGDPGYAEYVQEEKRKATGGTDPKVGAPKPEYKSDQLSAAELARYKELGVAKTEKMPGAAPTPEMNEEYRLAQLNTQRDLQKREAKPGATPDDELWKTKQSYMQDPTEYRRAKEIALEGPQKGDTQTAQTEEPRQLEGPPEPALLEDLRDQPLALEGETQPDALPGPEEKKALPPHPEQRALPPHPEQPALPPHPEHPGLLPAPEAPALPPHLEKKKTKIVFADISDVVEKEARDVADTRMEKERKELKGLKGLVKRIIKHNLLDPYYRRRRLQEARREIADTKNLYVGETSDTTSSDRAKQAILERFGSDYTEMLSQDETKEVYADLSGLARDAINEYARSGDAAKFQTDCDNILEELARKRGVSVEELKDSVNQINNLYKTAEQIRENYVEMERLGKAGEALLEDVEVVWGEAKSSVKTEAQFNRVDKLIDRLEKKSQGFSLLSGAVNELTIGAGAALAYSVATRLSQGLARSSVAKWVTFGGTAFLASGIAAAKENKRLIGERKKHLRDIAKGKQFVPAEQPRRREMAESQYETMEAKNLMDPLEKLYVSYDLQGERQLRTDLSPAEVQAAMNALAQIEARTRLDDERKIDLITYSDTQKVEDERYRLNLLRAQAKVDLRNSFDGLRAGLGAPEGTRFDQYLGEASDRVFNERDENVRAMDSRFKKMKTKKVAIRAAKTLALGVGFGMLAQEAAAFGSEGKEGALEAGIQAIFKKGGAGAERMTALRRIFGGELRPHTPGVESVFNIGGREIPVNLPQGTELVDPDGDGIYALMRDGQDVCSVEFNPDGTLSATTLEALQDKGIGYSSEAVTVTRDLPGGNDPESIRQYAEDHPGLFQKIKRTLWYDNDTPKPRFDKNELKLWWGGEGGTGVDAEGNFVFDIRQMKPDGSYHGDLSIDAQEAMKAGKLKMLLSLDQGSQNNVFEVQIGPDGKAIIPKDSEIGEMLFNVGAKGKAEFLGKYAEVAEMVGQKSEDGREMVRILATHVGEGAPEVPTPGAEEIPKHIFEIPSRGDYDLPPIIPIEGRYPLEPARKGEKEPSKAPAAPETPPPSTGEKPETPPTDQTVTEKTVEPPPVIPIGERTPLEPSRKKEEQAGEVEQGKKLTPEQIENREEFVQDSLQPTFNRWEKENGVKVTSVDLEETSPGEGKLTINIDPEGMPYDNRVLLIAAGAQEIKTDEGARTLIWEIPLQKRADVNQVIHNIEGVGAGFVVAAGVEKGTDEKIPEEDEEEKATEKEAEKKSERPKEDKDRTKRPARIRPGVKVNAGEAAETPAEPDLTFEEWDGVNQDVDFETKLPTRLRAFMTGEPTEKQVLENFIYLHSPLAKLKRDRTEGERAGGAIRVAHKVLIGVELSPAEKAKLSIYAEKRKRALAVIPIGERDFVTQYEEKVLKGMEKLYGEGKAEEPELDMAA